MSPFEPLHPTLKACKCGFIGTKTALYNHFKTTQREPTLDNEYFLHHGEVPLRQDDERLNLTHQLEQSLCQKKDFLNNI